jgi:hypothetical protein
MPSRGLGGTGEVVGNGGSGAAAMPVHGMIWGGISHAGRCVVIDALGGVDVSVMTSRSAGRLGDRGKVSKRVLA